jgi:hypothetical protein
MPAPDDETAALARSICRKAYLRRYGAAHWKAGELDVAVADHWRNFITAADEAVIALDAPQKVERAVIVLARIPEAARLVVDVAPVALAIFEADREFRHGTDMGPDGEWGFVPEFWRDRCRTLARAAIVAVGGAIT